MHGMVSIPFWYVLKIVIIAHSLRLGEDITAWPGFFASGTAFSKRFDEIIADKEDEVRKALSDFCQQPA